MRFQRESRTQSRTWIEALDSEFVCAGLPGAEEARRVVRGVNTTETQPLVLSRGNHWDTDQSGIKNYL